VPPLERTAGDRPSRNWLCSISAEGKMKLSARNQLKGKIVTIAKVRRRRMCVSILAAG
jgi:hypothetical protein